MPLSSLRSNAGSRNTRRSTVRLMPRLLTISCICRSSLPAILRSLLILRINVSSRRVQYSVCAQYFFRSRNSLAALTSPLHRISAWNTSNRETPNCFCSLSTISRILACASRDTRAISRSMSSAPSSRSSSSVSLSGSASRTRAFFFAGSLETAFSDDDDCRCGKCPATAGAAFCVWRCDCCARFLTLRFSLLWSSLASSSSLSSLSSLSSSSSTTSMRARLPSFCLSFSLCSVSLSCFFCSCWTCSGCWSTRAGGLAITRRGAPNPNTPRSGSRSESSTTTTTSLGTIGRLTPLAIAISLMRASSSSSASASLRAPPPETIDVSSSRGVSIAITACQWRSRVTGVRCRFEMFSAHSDQNRTVSMCCKSDGDSDSRYDMMSSSSTGEKC
eukprot:comp14888_c0_seq1/m.21924 comp14888_c0_seq1/g.21924  ORF comp14888_c0_seq1/g.21924 comp14888_c0_seq1/m.21924 type:complete len:389 (-) comp14888_c0_seq1:302-1468(-)